MGLWFSKLYEVYQSFGTTSARILMLGLDNAGKTTILYKMKLNETVTTIPTIGFNVETVEPMKGVSFTVWDIGGQDKIRPLWRRYFQNSEGLVYVVDSCDRERADEAAKELRAILTDDAMRGVPVVVMANKQDLPMAMSPAEVIDRLCLRSVTNRWHVQGTCATTGKGVYEAVSVLSRLVREFKRETMHSPSQWT